MLIGTFRGVQLSVEGVLVPLPLRTGLEQGFVMTRGLDRCVAVFPLPVWEAVLERIEQGTSFLLGAARLFQRHIYGGASVDDLGSDGRMKVPEHLRIYAGLGDEVVVVGVATRLEIWNPERWSEEEANIKEQAEEVSEALSQCGI
jgi:MraZ protein